MGQTYYCDKKTYTKQTVKEIMIFFNNGDYCEIRNGEIVDCKLNCYDKLVQEDQTYAPVIESGFIKLHIVNKASCTELEHIISDENSFRKNRKQYIEKRCQEEGSIKKIVFFHKEYNDVQLLCNVSAHTEQDFLILEFKEISSMGSCSNNKHNIELADVNKNNIFDILVDFENCDVFQLYADEIQELDFKFSEKLSDYEFSRVIESGYMIIKLDKYFDRRDCSIYDSDNPTIKDIERRLYGKTGEEECDICNLYITYHYPFSCEHRTEKISIEDLTDYSEFEETFPDLDDDNEVDYDETDIHNYLSYANGMCKKLSKNRILIAFGNDAEQIINEHK